MLTLEDLVLWSSLARTRMAVEKVLALYDLRPILVFNPSHPLHNSLRHGLRPSLGEGQPRNRKGSKKISLVQLPRAFGLAHTTFSKDQQSKAG